MQKPAQIFASGRQLLLLLFLGLSLAACNSTSDTAYTRLNESALQAGDAIPTPSGAAVLIVSGAIGASNVGDTIEMDMATIESLSQVEYRVTDPWLERQVSYRGPLMSELLDLWQVSPQATSLRMTALNDYMVEVPIDLLRQYPILLAVRADGDYMPVADRGPAMLVLPYDDYEFDRPADNVYWIWQIKSIEIE